MKKIKNLSRKAKVLILAFAVAITGTVSYSFTDNYFEISKNLEIFATLYRELNVYYVDDTQPGELMKTGIDAMLESLDPYTNYIAEADIEDYRFITTGEYGGIGSLIRSIDGRVYISEPYEGFPAQKVGLEAGDEIIKIDNKEIAGKDQEEVSKMLKGQSGTTLTITVDRAGEILDKVLNREEIKIPDVPYYGMVDDETGYIRLTSFTRTASKEVKEAFVDLKENHGMKKLVFDLRGNGGGLLREAVNIVNIFVPKGQEVVSTKGKIKEWDRSHVAVNEPLDTDIPLAVLVDESSASASEIVSGALQDLDRAIVVGRRTFGKGLVQQTRELQYNSKLKLTVAKYYIPSGRCIQKLDYSHKGSNGNVDEVPDSLLKTFTTKNGREVIDGRGIDPDLNIENREFPPILGSLLSANLFFEYATKFHRENPEILSAKEFRLSDDQYDNFVAFLGDKEYTYETRTEQLLTSLKEAAEMEKYYEKTESEYQQLADKLHSQKKDDLYIFKDEISELLENEIVSRYYYQVGRIEASLSSDPSLKEALNTLNSQEYYTILSGKGVSTSKN